jgi:hypothetical protein
VVTCGPEEFAEWFNERYPGAYRHIVTEDIKDLTDRGLIHHRGYYGGSSDGETIRAILQYEQLREKPLTQQRIEKMRPCCRRCGKPLILTLQDKPGRPKEYCPVCEPFRNKERQKLLRYRRKKIIKIKP